jgi:hypothetical protein
MAKESKKTFKLNIIDVIIIVVILLAAAFIGYKLINTGSVSTPTETVYITIYEEECADYVINNINIGDSASDGTTDITAIGTVTNVVTDTSATYEYDSTDDEFKRVPKPDYSSVYITIEAQGILNDNGVVIGSQQYAVGHTLILYAGSSKLYAQVYNISTEEPAA